MKKFFKNLADRPDGGSQRGGSAGMVGRQLRIGTFLVRVESQLGEGGYALLYTVRDVNSRAAYALKHVRMNGDREAIEDVKTEVAIMKQLKGHPNILALQEVTYSGPPGAEDEAFLLLDLCRDNLVEYMRRRTSALSPRAVLAIFSDVCKGVAWMHSQQTPLAHRDLKAENILLGPANVWLLCDFGSATTRAAVYDSEHARALEDERIRRQTTPAYRAPEMWDLYMRARIDVKVDIWALGCLLYYLCCSKLPFSGDAGLPVLNGAYDRPKDVPAPLAALIERLLTIDCMERPDIEEVQEMIKAAAVQLDSDAGAMPVLATTAASAADHAAAGTAARQASAGAQPAQPAAPPAMQQLQRNSAAAAWQGQPSDSSSPPDAGDFDPFGIGGAFPHPSTVEPSVAAAPRAAAHAGIDPFAAPSSSVPPARHTAAVHPKAAAAPAHQGGPTTPSHAPSTATPPRRTLERDVGFSTNAFVAAPSPQRPPPPLPATATAPHAAPAAPAASDSGGRHATYSTRTFPAPAADAFGAPSFPAPTPTPRNDTFSFTTDFATSLAPKVPPAATPIKRQSEIERRGSSPARTMPGPGAPRGFVPASAPRPAPAPHAMVDPSNVDIDPFAQMANGLLPPKRAPAVADQPMKQGAKRADVFAASGNGTALLGQPKGGGLWRTVSDPPPMEHWVSFVNT